MTDFNFRDGLMESTFSRGNLFALHNLSSSNIFCANEKYYPFIMKGTEVSDRTDADYIERAADVQFGGRVLNRERILEVMNSSKVLLSISVNSILYAIGKGFIGLYEGTKVIPLLVYTIPGADYIDNDFRDLTILVDNRYSLQPSVIKAIIQNCIKESKGDVIVTNDICKFLTGKIKLPRFRNITQRKEFIQNKIAEYVELL